MAEGRRRKESSVDARRTNPKRRAARCSRAQIALWQRRAIRHASPSRSGKLIVLSTDLQGAFTSQGVLCAARNHYRRREEHILTYKTAGPKCYQHMDESANSKGGRPLRSSSRVSQSAIGSEQRVVPSRIASRGLQQFQRQEAVYGNLMGNKAVQNPFRLVAGSQGENYTAPLTTAGMPSSSTAMV